MTEKTKLRDFPLFMAGCMAIAADNGCGIGPDAHMVNPDASTDDYTDALVFIECVLASLTDRIVGEFIPELPKMNQYEEIGADDTVLELVYNGVNDSAALILTKAKLAPHEVWLVEHVFDQFFQGTLHERFTMPVQKPRGKRSGRAH